MKKTMKVEGMHCGHCKNAVEKAVKSMAGVTSAEVDLAEKTLTLECDASIVTDDMLREAVEDEGYTIV